MTSSLQDLLDAFLNGKCPPEAFLSELSAYCDTTPDSSWEVLALLDQYHRRGKLSGDHFRTFRRKIEFHALGIADPGVVRKQHEPVAAVQAAPVTVESAPASVAAAPAAVVATPATVAPTPAVAATMRDDDELLRLRTALEMERERTRRYRNRIATLAEYGRQHRSAATLSEAVAVTTGVPEPSVPVSSVPVSSVPVPTVPAASAPMTRALVSRMLVVSAPVRARARRGKALVSAWVAQQRLLQRPHTWSSGFVLVAAATVISGSSSNVGHVFNAPGVATTPVTFEPAPELPAVILVPRTITLSSAKFVVLPGNSAATIQVERTGEPGDVARFKWWTESAGAKPGKDYVGQSQLAQFDAGETSVQLPVRILANPQRKHTEMFYVVIGDPDDEAMLGSNTRAAVFIMRAH